MNWRALAEAVIRRRVELGHDTRKAFIAASGIGARSIGDIETARRDSYDPATLARLETALSWPTGRIRTILDGPDPPEPVSWLSTREGLARHLHRDDLPLVELLHRSGLPDTAKFDLILRIRAARERQNADLLGDVGQAIRQAGGWAPEQAYPPLWLSEATPEA